MKQQRSFMHRWRSFLTMWQMDDREMPVLHSISLGLLLVPGQFWLQMRSPTAWMFIVVLADRGPLLPFCRSIVPVSSTRVIKLHKVLFHFHDRNSRVILNILQPFSNLKDFIKFCHRLLKEPCL